MIKRCFLLIVLVFMNCETNEKDNRMKFFPKHESKPKSLPKKENVWVFILAGQSNMAGRAFVEEKDTISNNRILSINKYGELILAKEPLHFYEPKLSGLGCGLSFGNEMLNHIPDSVSIVLIPTAIGGSSIHQWISNSRIRGVSLFSNFKEKIEIGKKVGTIKGILWHQGENDAINAEMIEIYKDQLKKLFLLFRDETENSTLPIFIGELGSFSKNDVNWQSINKQIRAYVKLDSNTYLIKTNDLKDKGDQLHFNSESQRILGRRFAEEFINQLK